MVFAGYEYGTAVAGYIDPAGCHPEQRRKFNPLVHLQLQKAAQATNIDLPVLQVFFAGGIGGIMASHFHTCLLLL